MDSLFSQNLTAHQPLAEQLRPQGLDQFVGQEKLIGEKGSIRTMIEQDLLVSMIFWGPPGSGKTTLAKIIANLTEAEFITISAVSSGVKDLRKIIDQAKTDKELHQKKSILFIDEIHRWNKSQQDALLPYIEQGIITLIGATTENPSFELNNALLSRSQVFVFDKLSKDSLLKIINRATDKLSKEVSELIAGIAEGDARVALNTVEMLQKSYDDISTISEADVKNVLEKVALRYDRAGEEHFNTISALHKTMRASDTDAALYWCGRMLNSGEDPLYVMRRVVEFASEDIGNADPQALQLCIAAYQTVHFLGLQEGQYAVFQAVAYCANAPKSRAIYNVAKQINTDIKETENSPVPMHLRNAPTQLMKDVGYGKDKGQSNLPEHLKDRKYFNS
ncbi:MAG: replication-associated recombination protein A [bacterium]|nr:replication-associated recombination protein A [bacterium]